ncbi:hypothetical protein C789_5283 [Microcystis aeruginosa FACHB-905 = DIANCHI905]|nr:hypothetical protein C789_5283 [Microcystis aeruginosa FACHB-905 = DIANCHI905]
MFSDLCKRSLDDSSQGKKSTIKKKRAIKGQGIRHSFPRLLGRIASNTISLNENYTSNLNPPLSSPF